VLELRFWLG